MIRLPKITKIEGGAATVNSDAFSLDNYKTLAFLFENTAGATLSVKVKASADGGAAVPVNFLLKAVDAADFEEVESDSGKEITDAGAFLAVVNDRMLAHDEFDSVSVSLEADTGEVGTVYAIQDAPRYFVEDNE